MRALSTPQRRPPTLREINRAQEAIDVALEEVEDLIDDAETRAHEARIDAMTHEELLAEIGVTPEQLTRRVAHVRGLVASYEACAGCGDPALVEDCSTYESDDSFVGQSWVTSVCAGCWFTHGESAVSGEG